MRTLTLALSRKRERGPDRIVDELDGEDQNGWRGRGRLFGLLTFCHFRLEPI